MTDYRAIRCAEDLHALEQCLSEAEVCALDTETSGKDPRRATLYGVSLAVKEGQAFYVPMMQSDLDGISPEDVRVRLTVALSRKLKLVGHNLKYDFAVLQRNGIEVQDLHFDTLLAAHECFGDWDFWNLSSSRRNCWGRRSSGIATSCVMARRSWTGPSRNSWSMRAVTPTWLCAFTRY